MDRKEGFDEEWELRRGGGLCLRRSFFQNAAGAHFLFWKTMAKGSRKADLHAVCLELVERMGYELVDAAFEKEHSGMYLRVYLDSEAGISLKDCEAFHRRLQPLVEQMDYDFLEVCSPGIDRPIKTQRDALRAMGSQVEIRLYQPLEGRKQFSGVFQGLDEKAYHLQVGERLYSFPAGSVASAKRVIDIEQALAEQPPRDQEGSI